MNKTSPIIHQPDQAEQELSSAIAYVLQQAIVLHQQGRLARAEALYKEILKARPRHTDALHMLGALAIQTGHTQSGIDLIEKSLEVDPDQPVAHAYIGNALRGMQRLEDALASYGRALRLKPDYAEVLFNQGNLLLEMNRPEEALASYDRVLLLQPDSVAVLINRGGVLLYMKRPEAALDSYDRALRLKPDYPEVLFNRGNALADMARFEAALDSYDRALRLKSDYAEALNNRGKLLLEMNRPEEALASLDRALQLNPDYPKALFNRGNALGYLLRHEDAADCFARLVEVDPDHDYALGKLHYSRCHCCDWANMAQIADKIVTSIREGRRADVPFSFLSVSQSAADQLQCARIHVADKYPAFHPPLRTGRSYHHDRIRVAYLSADFHGHATAYLMAELFERHDRERFEITAISFGIDAGDDMRKRLQRAFDRFVDVRGMSDREAALLLRDLEIDIAVDLKGYTHDCRTGILAHRPAPIQVNYLGYPGTMGADYIDYLLADAYLIPPEHQSCYSEKVVYLPDSYQVNNSRRTIAERTPARAEVNLPAQGFVFCCFNNNYKITPDIFDIWMNLLNRVEGSVMWLLESNAAATRNLRREAGLRGVAPERLVFAPRMQRDGHLARHGCADLFLDTLPVNAHTTASDALWAGLPVITCMGNAFAGRVAGSLLNAVGLPELITRTLEEYEELAFKLATTPALLTDIRTKLAQNRYSYPLFDTDRFRRHIESAYITMWERCQRGETPAGFSVLPSN